MREIKFRAWDKVNNKMVRILKISESIYGDCEVPYIEVCELEVDFNKFYNTLIIRGK